MVCRYTWLAKTSHMNLIQHVASWSWFWLFNKHWIPIYRALCSHAGHDNDTICILRVHELYIDRAVVSTSTIQRTISNILRREAVLHSGPHQVMKITLFQYIPTADGRRKTRTDDLHSFSPMPARLNIPALWLYPFLYSTTMSS